MRLRRRFKRRPAFIKSGEHAYVLPRHLVERNAEQAIAVEFVSHRQLFGDGYSQLQPDYFWAMPADSGVFVLLFLPTHHLSLGCAKPGDVDLLIVPYEGDELVLDRTLAVELKVVRASYERQGRSPNEFGVSQAVGLRALGFPYSAVAHLIVSDQSPRGAWAEMMTFQVLDDHGRVGEPFTRDVDTLPLGLIARTYGRLQKACSVEEIGLLSTFVRYADLELAAKYKRSIWYAKGRQAIRNAEPSPDLLEKVGDLFEAHPEWWFDNPRHD